MVARLGYRPEMHGVWASRVVPRNASNLPLLKNITAFLMDQNRQFEDVIRELTYARDSLDSARYKLDPVQLYCLYGHAHARQTTKSRPPHVVGRPHYRFLSASPYHDQGIVNVQRDPRVLKTSIEIYRTSSPN